MKRANTVNRVSRKQKRRGPPRTTGPGTLVGIRCHDDFLKRVDDWQASKAPEASRPQAIRQLAEIGLDHEEDQA